MRTITYARFSTDRQTEASIEDQQRVCREFAAARGWQIVGEFTDQGISGAAMGNRPGANAALAAAGSGDLLLLADLTRLARSQDLAPMIDRLRFRGVRVIGVLDSFDSDAPHAGMQAGLSGLMSSELRASIRVRTHSALQMRAQQQRPTGGRCYGYDAAGILLEDEAAVVREIFERAAQGETLRGMALSLNTRGVPAPGAGWQRETRAADGRWRVSGIHALLENERYIGRLVWNRSEWVKDPDTGKRQRRERPKDQWVIRECPAIVDRKTFESVRMRSTERARAFGGGRGGPARYLLSGILLCESCGQRLIATGKAGSHYYCSTWRHAGTCQLNTGVRRDVAEERILQPVHRDLLSPEAVAHALAWMRALAQEERAETVAGGPELEAIEAQMADLQGLIAEKPDRRVSLSPALEAMEQRKAALQRRAWRSGSSVKVDAQRAEAAYTAAVDRLREVLAGPVLPARQALRELLGDVPVRLSSEGVVATVRFQPLLISAAIARNGSGGVQPSRVMPAEASIIRSVLLRAA